MSICCNRHICKPLHIKNNAKKFLFDSHLFSYVRIPFEKFTGSVIITFSINEDVFARVLDLDDECTVSGNYNRIQLASHSIVRKLDISENGMLAANTEQTLKCLFFASVA